MKINFVASTYVDNADITVQQAGSTELTTKQKRTLALKAKRGDLEARDKLVEYHLRYLKPLANALKRKYSTTVTASELCSDAYTRLLTVWEKYDPDRCSDPTAYVKSCAWHEMMSSIRVGFKRSILLLGDKLGEVSDPFSEEDLTNDDDLKKGSGTLIRENIRKILQRNNYDQIILELLLGIDLGTNPDLEELSTKEIGVRIGISESLIRVRKHRILQKLKKQLIAL